MKKKILVLIILLTFPIICLGASNPYPKTQNFDGYTSTPCTRVAWQEVYDRLGIALPGWGNAVTWLDSAKKAGYQVGVEAKPNSVAVYSGFYDYGHVAFVIEVNEENMKVVENNYETEGKHESTVSKEVGSGNGVYLMGFIYVTEPKTNTSTGSTTTTTTTTKSGNSNLKSLEIENYTIDFQKDNYYYELSVPSECEKISLKATADNSKATVKYDKEVTLNEGSNLIEIKVTAEDKSESIYVLNVTRESVEETIPDNQNEEENNLDEIEDIPEENAKTKENKTFLSSYYSIIIGGIVVAIILLLVTFIIWKKKKIKNKNYFRGL